MKNPLKFLAVAFVSILTFASCSSEDDTLPNKEEQAIVKVELSNNQYFQDFEESLNIQIVTDPNKNVNVSGENWDSVENPQNVAKWFLKSGDLKQTRTFITSDKVRSLTISSVISPKEIDSENQNTLVTTIKIYVNDKLAKTENHVTTYGAASTFTLPIAVGAE